MDPKQLNELLRLIKKLDFAEFKMAEGDFSMTVRSEYKPGHIPAPQIVSMAAPAAPLAAPVAATVPVTDVSAVTETEESTGNLLEIRSPIVGTFYRAASPDKPPYVKVGDSIAAGDVVCIVEAMKLFNEIESEVSGKIVKVLIEEAKPVEYDQVLYLVDPNA
ncbi:MAG TPA: acetyl-CoA carboxylase, biotin carboxyl carrier protein [Saprospirales bacterium]|nr:acetyl-CoA carboxylase, biotin carboxyl carrier protein [Saprospirales bacterium]|tara:strand:+ start:2390 stop:2875 length:486 start_codon:yes stop_codon:yes gene_type:complete